MSSDLPDMRHEDGLSMAKVLVTYMADPRAVQLAVRTEFDCTARGISLTTIRQLRKAHLESLLKPAELPHKLHEGHDPAAVARKLEDINKRFLTALERERAISAEWAKAQGALHSPALRKPEIVNQAWDRETEMAWLQNGELRL